MVRKLILEKLAEKGMTMSEASIKIGRSHSYLQQFLKRGVPAELLERERRNLAGLLDVSENELRGPSAALPSRDNAAINSGLKLRSDTEYQITFDRPWGNQGTAAVIGALISTDASSVVERLTFSVADTGSGTRVVLDRYMVKTGSFGRERVEPANNGLGAEPLQDVLDRVTKGITP